MLIFESFCYGGINQSSNELHLKFTFSLFLCLFVSLSQNYLYSSLCLRTQCVTVEIFFFPRDRPSHSVPKMCENPPAHYTWSYLYSKRRGHGAFSGRLPGKRGSFQISLIYYYLFLIKLKRCKALSIFLD